jgi:hypothetical protein
MHHACTQIKYAKGYDISPMEIAEAQNRFQEMLRENAGNAVPIPRVQPSGQPYLRSMNDLIRHPC